jgi:hypothetical protein
MFLDEPTQPGRPNILDWGPNHCDLSWTPPESDGGAPITHYVIEMKVHTLRLYSIGPYNHCDRSWTPPESDVGVIWECISKPAAIQSLTFT